MDRIIKKLPVTGGDLSVISAGERRPLAHFNGRIEIIEKIALIPMLGKVQRGTRTIYASFIICGDLEYQMETPDEFIHSGNIYEADADVGGERLCFAGLRFEDLDPVADELTFEITDLSLIQKLMI